LLYKLEEPCLIKEFFWRIFSAEGYSEHIYPSNKIKILLGITEDKFHFESEEFLCEENNELQSFKLNKKAFGLYLKVIFIGKPRA